MNGNLKHDNEKKMTDLLVKENRLNKDNGNMLILAVISTRKRSRKDMRSTPKCVQSTRSMKATDSSRTEDKKNSETNHQASPSPSGGVRIGKSHVTTE